MQVATQPPASGPLHSLCPQPGTHFPGASVACASSPWSLPRPLLPWGCVREERGSIYVPDPQMFVWAFVLEKMCRCKLQTGSATRCVVQVDRCMCWSDRVRGCPGQRGDGCAELAFRESPAIPDVGLGAIVSQLQAHPSQRGSG